MLEILLAILLAAKMYGVSPEYMLCVASYESDFRPAAVGDNGKAVGLYQWHKPSWEYVRGKMGEDPDPELREGPTEAAQTAAYAMGELGLYRWWSTDHLCREYREE